MPTAAVVDNLLNGWGTTKGSSTGGWPWTHVCGNCLRYLLPGEDCPTCAREALTLRDERDLLLLGVL